MSYLALYRKYRPNNFKDLVGQNDVADVIKNEILNNKISHAYLFSGPRGTGKTSTAKIIARMVNCHNLGDDGVPCGECDGCRNFNSSSDVFEIDAASNNGVDEIRELRDKVNLVPTSCKYKIYIIDEVHMLTTQAFNALLKTLEEPPEHAIFILATTEFYKIPATVVSRCQRFQFLKFSINEISDRLRQIASLENIDVSDDVLYEIARLADGGLRDAINMFDQLSSYKENSLTVDDVYKLNGVVSYDELAKLLMFVKKNQVAEVIDFLNLVDKMGKSLSHFIGDLLEFLKDILIYKSTSEFNGSIKLKNEKIRKISDIYSIEEIYDLIVSINELMNSIKNSSFSIILIISFFISKIELMKKNNDLEEDVKDIKNFDFDKKISGSNEKTSIEIEINDNTNNMKQKSFIFDERLKKIRINNTFATASKQLKSKFLERWRDFVDKIELDRSNSLAGIIGDVEVLVVGNSNVIFLVKYDSLLDRIYNYVLDLEKELVDIYNVDYKIVFLASDEWNYEKEKYINNLKIGKKYDYIDENDNINNGNDEKVENIVSSDDVDKLISLVGNDVISYE